VNCAAAQDLAADLVLGSLAGDERAQLLEHVATCPACAGLVTDLGIVVDRLLLLGPEVDPPAGFETAVLRRVRPRHRARTWLAVAAALVLVAGTAVGIERYRQNGGLTREYVTALHNIGGTKLRAARLIGPANTAWGQAFVYEGTTSWVFVSMQWDVPNGTYAIALDRQHGQPTMVVNGLHLVNGEGSLGRTVGHTSDITDVRVVDTSGQTVCTARLTT
jgi:hypothetical protein